MLVEDELRLALLSQSKMKKNEPWDSPTGGRQKPGPAWEREALLSGARRKPLS